MRYRHYAFLSIILKKRRMDFFIFNRLASALQFGSLGPVEEGPKCGPGTTLS